MQFTHSHIRAFLAALLLTMTGLGFFSTSLLAEKAPVYQGLVKNTAVGGYDPVSYFTEGKAIIGNQTITHKYQGATWRFSTTANRDAFKAAPEKYAPQYGGYCAWAVSQGYTAKGDPHAWKIHNGKLYLNYNKSVQATWAKNIPANVKKGDNNWPKVLK